MSDLTVFHNHARHMATARHRPECRNPGTASRWDAPVERGPVVCAGCVTDADRVLWVQIVEELDAYSGRRVARA